MRTTAITVILFALPLLGYSQGGIRVTAGRDASPFIMNLDEIKVVRPQGTGAVVTYGPTNSAVYIHEPVDTVCANGCGQIICLDILEPGRTVTVGIGLRHIQDIRPTSDGRATIRMVGGAIPSMKTSDTWTTVAGVMAICASAPSGGGGGGTADLDSLVSVVYDTGTGILTLTLQSGQTVFDTIPMQTLALTNDTLSISYGNSVIIPNPLLTLPEYPNDEAAMADGLAVGHPYILTCNETYGLQPGLLKYVKLCECGYTIMYYISDLAATTAGFSIWQVYALDEANVYGGPLGMVKTIWDDALPTNDSLVCNDTLLAYDNHAAALAGGLSLGDHYKTTATNTFGAPENVKMVVSNEFSTVADAEPCCDPAAILPSFENDAAALAGGLVAGNWYLLNVSNTYGFPAGTRKQI